ncbi:hypothetical protein [Chroococcidiopsis sp.]
MTFRDRLHSGLNTACRLSAIAPRAQQQLHSTSHTNSYKNVFMKRSQDG